VSAAGLACLMLAAACLVAGLVALRALRRRLEMMARAEHEVRGPATAITLACRRMRRDPHAARYADLLEAQLERMRAGLDDLAVARGGGRARTRSPAPVDLAPFVRATLEPWRAKLRRCSLDWRAGAAVAVADRGRLAQALGNLLANSAEHGNGDLGLRAVRVPGAVRLEVRNENRTDTGDGSRGDRGRGLSIAADAAREMGGRLLVHGDRAATTAVLELPEGAVVSGPASARTEAERAAGGEVADRERPPHGDDRTDSDLVA
jgi:signal transduction histidine kinase